MLSQIESIITNVINGEYNNEERIKSIYHLYKLLIEDKQQMVNDQAKLIVSQQKLIEMLQQANVDKKKNIMNENSNKDLVEFSDNVTTENSNGLKPLYKVFIGQLPPNVQLIQIKNHLNEIFGYVDSVYQLIPESNYGFALFSNYDACQKAISRGNIRIQDKSFYIHNAHDRENNF